MNEFEVAIIELSRIIAKKEISIKAKDIEIRHMYDDNKELRLDLEKYKKENHMLKNDLKDLSTEFNKWRNGKTEKKEKN